MAPITMPAEIEHGYAVARLILARTDGPDADQLPDPVPAVGTAITISPRNQNLRVTEGGQTVLVVARPIQCKIDAAGYLVTAQVASTLAEGQAAAPEDRGVWLITGTYSVAYTSPDAKIDKHDIEVLASHTEAAPLDILGAMPPGGPVLTASQYAELKARMDTIELTPGPPGPTGVDRAPVTVLTNPTAIPTEPAGRLDLVFTEPTTVAFDVPGRTDLVLAIDGWDFITWSGAVVHGAPDATKTVWASAMWRDLDSSWHVLAVQEDLDAGGSAGQGLEMVTTDYTWWRLVKGANDPDGYPTYTHTVMPATSTDFVTRFNAPDYSGTVHRHAVPVLTGIPTAIAHKPYAKTPIRYDHIKNPDTAPVGWKLEVDIVIEGPRVRITGYIVLCADLGFTGYSWGGTESPPVLDNLVLPGGGDFKWGAYIPLDFPRGTGSAYWGALSFNRTGNNSIPTAGISLDWSTADDGTSTLPPRTGESGAPANVFVPEGAYYIPINFDGTVRTGIEAPL